MLLFTGEDSPMDNLLLSVMGAFAEFERALMRERQREGIALAKKTGHWYQVFHYHLLPSAYSLALGIAELGPIAAGNSLETALAFPRGSCFVYWRPIFCTYPGTGYRLEVKNGTRRRGREKAIRRPIEPAGLK